MPFNIIYGIARQANKIKGWKSRRKTLFTEYMIAYGEKKEYNIKYSNS